MSRLITLRTVMKEKVQRSRSWILAREDFPPPAVRGNPNLWLESAVDEWVRGFVASANTTPLNSRHITAKARAARGA